jgi:GntR family transcriptional regulator
LATRADLAAQELERRILAREYPAGSQLPNEADLALALNVSRTTLRESVGRLEAKGLVSREQGRGTYVLSRTSVRISMLLEANLSVSDMIRDMGLTPATAEVSARIEVPPEHVSGALGLRELAPLLVVHRLRTADSVPVAFSDDYIVIVPDLPRSSDRYHGSLYELLASVYGRPVASGQARLRAGQASGDLARKLDIPDGSLTLVLSQVHQLADGTAVMFSDAYLRNDVFTVHVRRGLPDRETASPPPAPPSDAYESAKKAVPIASTA